MKNKFLVILLLFLFPTIVQATSYNTAVSNNLTYQECFDFQDEAIYTNESGYVGYCKKSVCQNSMWEQSFLKSNIVNCKNENDNPYIQVINDGCDQYKGSCTKTTDYKYCSQVVYYDCTKTTDGKVYDKSSVTTTLDNNNFLSSLKLSEGKINFKKEVIVYNVEVDQDTKSIDVEAIAESSKSKTEIFDNKSITENKPITIKVTAEDKSERIYTINVKYLSQDLSSNNLIKKISIDNYNLNFKPQTNNYKLKVKEDIKKLDIDIDLQNEKANYVIIGNHNLKNNSIIRIIVKAENGEENTYTIKVKKRKNLIIGVIILLFLGIIFIILFRLLRKFIPTRKDKKYGYE